MKKIFRLVMVLFLAFVLVGCGGGNKLTGITIKTERNRSQIQIGTTLQFTAVAQPAEAELGTVTWSVNNPSVATINENGLLTANATTAGIVKVTATTDSGFTANKTIRVSLEAVAEYPDLGGYEIKIAQATVALGEVNPFMPEETKAQYGYYGGLDREARQLAWTSVEEDFNCTINVVEYPVDAPWGPSRWNYIVNQARLDDPQYDFYIVPDAQIPGFVSANAIRDLTEWYDSYGNNLMNNLNKTAGSYKNKLYSINTGDPAIYNMMGYNYDLWVEINAFDPTIEEPAKMFNDGHWSYTTFVDYSLKVQQALTSLYGAEGGYYAVSGWPTYYWVGMVDRNGTGVADVTSLQMHLTGADETAAGEALKSIYAAGAFDPAFSVDGGVASFNGGKALFNTGDLWFIGTNQDRWPAEINYGYVPFPAPDGYDTSKYYVGLTAEACWVMAAGREKYYTAYGEDCTAENIYWAIMQYWYRAKDNYQKADNYDPAAQLQSIANSKFGSSKEGMKAFITMSENLDTYAFYDPLTSNSNTIVATYASDLDIAIRDYVKGTGAATWNEAVGSFQDTLDKAIVDAFG